MQQQQSQRQFYYPINLHYSQTPRDCKRKVQEFYYPINLHYSQTRARKRQAPRRFYYPINLHYSQTSNCCSYRCVRPGVLLPYKFTLLSNCYTMYHRQEKFYYPINLHYSQTLLRKWEILQKFYYPINLHYSQTTSRFIVYI